jgi:hypothetical protein
MVEVERQLEITPGSSEAVDPRYALVRATGEKSLVQGEMQLN